MKKINFDAKRRFLIKSEAEMAKREKENRKVHKSNTRYKSPRNLPVVDAPDYMGLSSEYIRKCLNFFKQVTEGGKKFRIDFSNVKEIDLSAAIVLYSVIEQLRDKQPDIKIYFRYNLKDENLVRYVCKNTRLEGIAKGVMPSNDKNSHLKIISIDAASSESKNIHGAHALERIKSIDDKFFADKMNKEQKHFLYRGITEALLNVTDHAYAEKDDEGLKKYWTTAIHQGDWLHIAIYDRGIGIPQSIRKKFEFLRLFTDDSTIKDSDLIAKAVQKIDKNYLSRIRNKNKVKTNRGKGLTNIRELTKNFNMEARLVIISNKGCYSEYSSRGERTSVDQRLELDVPLQGTLIQWSIKLN